MTTLGQVVAQLEERLFVGRLEELAVYRAWLVADSAEPEILNVSGPGGIGKSALLSAFGRVACSFGLPVVRADASSFQTIPRGLLQTLGGGSLDDVIHRLNGTQPVLLLDAVEHSARMSGYLRNQFLPHLDAGVRVVIASRRPLAQLWPRDDLWNTLIRSLPLHALDAVEARTYLERRGLGSAGPLVDQILAATHGYPLGLSLGADLALRLHLSSLEGVPEWRLVVRTLVERLCDTEDPEVCELLESAAVVRRFDEAVLAAVTRRPPNLKVFGRLCVSSVVRSTSQGLEIHDDVQHLLRQDLDWRNPERNQLLRRRAAEYYRERACSVDTAQRAMLMRDRLFLSDHRALQSLLFSTGLGDGISVGTSGPDDRGEIHAIWDSAGRSARNCSARPCVHAQGWEEDKRFLDVLLDERISNVRVARDRSARPVGFVAFLPLSRASLPLLQLNFPLRRLIDAYLTRTTERLPHTIDASNIVCHAHVLHELAPCQTSAVLLRESFDVLSRGGIHLVSSTSFDQHAAFETLGFEPIPESSSDWCRSAPACTSYVLDMTRTGVDGWLEALASGQRPPPYLGIAEVEHELQLVLSHWHDDGWLSRSGLWRAGPLRGLGLEERSAARMREFLGRMLRQLIGEAEPQDRLALRAVELGYVVPHVSHEAAAERLAVSRATFYRMLKRGTRGLAQGLLVFQDLALGSIVPLIGLIDVGVILERCLDGVA